MDSVSPREEKTREPDEDVGVEKARDEHDSVDEPQADESTQKNNRGHRIFGRLGRLIAAHPGVALVIVVGLCGGWSSGWFRDNIVNDKLFASLLLRPGTRLQRETDRWKERENDGYRTGNEATNGRATRGGKNVLTTKNMEQVYRFFRDARVPEIEIAHRSVTYTAPDVLRFAGSQPYRFTVLDCFQEGAYDYGGEDLKDLSASADLLVGIVDELLAPFGPPRSTVITPYSWCLYARLGVAYAPNVLLDPHRFGRCRQFVDVDYYEAFGRPLAAAYDFHRFQSFDLVKSSPSFEAAYGCKRPFLDEGPGRCHPVLTCCEVSVIYSTCAACELNGTSTDDCIVDLESDGGGNGTSSFFLGPVSCGTYGELLENGNDWNVNAEYDPSYATLKDCTAFDFWPVSTIYGGLFVQAPAAVAAETEFTDCPDRSERFFSSVGSSRSYVETAMEMYCTLSGANTCPTTLGPEDYEWDYGFMLASDVEVADTALSGECAQW